MGPRQIIAGVAFVGLMAALTSEPFADDDLLAWAYLTLAAAHIAAGLAIARWWALGLAVVLPVTTIAEGANELTFLLLFPATGIALGLLAVGVAIGRRLSPRAAAPAIAAAVVVSLAGPAVAAAEWSQRGPHAPDAVEARLPMDLRLDNLCTKLEPELRAGLRREYEALLVEVRRRPDELVTYTFHWAHEPSETRDITIRELAEERLEDLETHHPRGCRPDLQARLRAAIDAS